MSIDRIAAGLWTFLAYFGLIMLAGAENAMSAYAGYNFGTHDLERYLYAAAYSGNELLKVALLWKLGQAFAQPGSLTVKALRIGVGALVLTPLVLLISLSGHVGFVGLVRGDTVAVRTAALVKTDDAAAVIKADQAQLDQMRTNRKWSASPAMHKRYARYNYIILQRIPEGGGAGRARARDARHDGRRRPADPQVDILTMLFPGREKKELQLGLALAVGGAISFISFLGFFVAGHHHAKVADVEGLKDMAEKLREGSPTRRARRRSGAGRSRRPRRWSSSGSASPARRCSSARCAPASSSTRALSTSLPGSRIASTTRPAASCT